MASFISRRLGYCLLSFASLSFSSGLYYKHYQMQKSNEITLSNYSGHKKVQIMSDNLFEPSSEAELTELMYKLRKNPKMKARPVGSGLSHNGISFESKGMISMENMKSILEIDKKNMTVTAESGITVQELMEELGQQGFALENITSISSQQIGGWCQTGSHGSGMMIPPMDEFIEKLKIYSPTYPDGIILSKNDPDPKIRDMFYGVRVGMGITGVISNITFRILERKTMIENTYVVPIDELEKKHQEILNSNMNVKYLWIPYTNEVVVKLVNPVSKEEIDTFLKNEKKHGVGDETLKSFNRRGLLERGVLDVANIKETNRQEINQFKTICNE